MSTDKLAEVRQRHQQFEMLSRTASGHERYLACERCREPWPCDAVAIAEEVDRLKVLAAWTRGVVFPERYIERMGFPTTDWRPFLAWFNDVIRQGHALIEEEAKDA